MPVLETGRRWRTFAHAFGGIAQQLHQSITVAVVASADARRSRRLHRVGARCVHDDPVRVRADRTAHRCASAAAARRPRSDQWWADRRLCRTRGAAARRERQRTRRVLAIRRVPHDVPAHHRGRAAHRRRRMELGATARVVVTNRTGAGPVRRRLPRPGGRCRAAPRPLRHLVDRRLPPGRVGPDARGSTRRTMSRGTGTRVRLGRRTRLGHARRWRTSVRSCRHPRAQSRGAGGVRRVLVRPAGPGRRRHPDALRRRWSVTWPRGSRASPRLPATR